MVDLHTKNFKKSGNIARIETSFIDIPGKISYNIYLSGCIFNCHNCHNKLLQNPNYGTLMNVDDVIEILDDNELVEWVCFLGGEPFYQSDFLYELCKKINKPIGIFTGNDFDILCEKYIEIISLENIKFLKTGRFIENLVKNNEFPISSNQQVYLKHDDIWKLQKSRSVTDISKKINNI